MKTTLPVPSFAALASHPLPSDGAAIFYNEFDKNAAQWLRNLGDENLITPGKVDERSIKELSGADLPGVRRAHFFAGIGGWDEALHLAAWPVDREVWTGSCPCQPFSAAGKGKGVEDERHLWPDFLRLIAERRPATVFGEQVASKAGRQWVVGVRSDLEALGYRVGVADLCAAGVGAPHIRQRLYWVADRGLAQDADVLGRGRGRDGNSSGGGREVQATGLRAVGGIPNNQGFGLETEPDDGWGRERETEKGNIIARPNNNNNAGGLGDGGRNDLGRDAGGAPRAQTKSHCGGVEHGASGIVSRSTGDSGGLADDDDERLQVGGEGRPQQNGVAVSPWSDYLIVPCTDGKARRTGAGVFPLAYGLPRGVGPAGPWRKGLARSASRARIGMLKGSGNAIVPELAAIFITAYLESK